jgi:CRISPR-associated protein Csm4
MLYRYKIIPKAPLITPLMSDTFFGHFCWALWYQRGDEYLTHFLDSYGKEKPAPVLFSSAFVSGYLPRPALPSLGWHKIKGFVSTHFREGKKDLFQEFSRIKSWNKRRLISVHQWLQLKEDYSEERLYEAFLNEEGIVDKKISELEIAMSNMIDRVSGTVPQEGGGLFVREKIWYHKGIDLDVYVEVNREEIEDLVIWFLTDHLQESGFGADKSIGMGSLSISRDDSFDPGQFAVPEPNARLSLSMSSFPGMESYDASYRLKTKFGKLGGMFASSSPTGGNPKPFKKPVLMYEPGAVFFCSNSLNDRSLLNNVHSDDRIRHCGIPITFPFKLREVDKYASKTAQ